MDRVTPRLPTYTGVDWSQRLTTGQAARLLNISPRTVGKLIDSGELPGYRIPGSKDRRIKTTDLVVFLQAHGCEVPPELCQPVTITYAIAGRIPGAIELTSPVEAGAAIRQHPVSAAVVSDSCGMGVALEVCAALRTRNPRATVFLVVGEDVEMGGAENVSRVWRQPVDWAALNAALSLATGLGGRGG